MSNKPSLYATLPVGTLLYIETFYLAPSGNWAYCNARVVADLGGDNVEVEVSEEEAASRRVARRFTIAKERIREVKAGPGASLDTYMNPAACVDRLWREYTKHGRLIVATDWDETCQAFHGGTTHDMIIDLLRRCSALGFHIYIFTASNPERWPAMKAQAKEWGITVADGVNVNPVPLPFGNWGKPYWNCLLDDRAGLSAAYQTLLAVVERAEAQKA